MKTMMTRRALMQLGIGALALLAGPTWAQSDWPIKPVTLIVPFPAGGGTDAFARPLAAVLSKELGQQFIIDNRGGAGGTVGASAAAKAPADGYTLFVGAVHHSIAPSMYPKLDYSIQKDFIPLAVIARVPQVLVVNPKIPVNNMAELIAYAKANPGKLTYMSAGSGTSPHMAGELLKTMTGIDIQHIPYKQVTQGLTDLLAGEIAMSFYHVPVIYPHVKSGRLKAMGVATSERSPIAPDVPPIGDTVKGYDLRPWWGLAGPAGMPQDIVDKLDKATLQCLKDPDMQKRLVDIGVIVTPMNQKDFNAFMATELVKWTKLVKDSGAKVN